MITKTKDPLPYHPGTHSNLLHKLVEFDAVELLKRVLDLVRDERHNDKLFTVNEEIAPILKRIYEDYLTMPQVGVNQKVVRGDRPIHIAVRNCSLKVLGFI